MSLWFKQQGEKKKKKAKTFSLISKPRKFKSFLFLAIPRIKRPLPVIHNPNVRKEPVIADSVAFKKIKK